MGLIRMRQSPARLIFCLLMLFFLMPLTVHVAGAAEIGPLRSADLDALLMRIDQSAEPDAGPVKLIVGRKTSAELALALSGTGGHIAYARGGEVQVNVPAHLARRVVGRLPAGAVVRLPYPHVPTAVTSEGVSLTGAGSMHALGHTGAGIRIGVIDLGFGALAGAQTSGDLPLNLIAMDYTATGIGGINHGTQVAEIVHDMAPGADLYLAKISTSLELAQAVDDMIAAGVQVIVHSVAWFGAAFYDGTGPLCGIADSAAAAGVLWVNAAGNHRFKHYLATFADADNDLRHDFATGNGNTLQLAAGQSVSLVLNWNDYPVSGNDYDLLLFFGSPGAGGIEVARADTLQRGTTQPLEVLKHTATIAGQYHVVVQKRRRSVADLPFTLFVVSGPNLGEFHSAASLAQPADCSGVIAVGAINLSDMPAGFSSEGPSTDGRLKPEIAAPSLVTTSLSATFSGTSAAAPHAGGALALLLGANPDLDAGQILDMFLAGAHDVHVAGFDSRTGWGRVSLDADGDGLNQDEDNCPLLDNPGQADRDGNGIGDVCEPPAYQRPVAGFRWRRNFCLHFWGIPDFRREAVRDIQRHSVHGCAHHQRRHAHRRGSYRRYDRRTPGDDCTGQHYSSTGIWAAFDRTADYRCVARWWRAGR